MYYNIFFQFTTNKLQNTSKKNSIQISPMETDI